MCLPLTFEFEFESKDFHRFRNRTARHLPNLVYLQYLKHIGRNSANVTQMSQFNLNRNRNSI